MATVHEGTLLLQPLVAALEPSVLLVVVVASLAPYPALATSPVSPHMPSHQQLTAAVVQME
jgi:hypothetical protein